MALNYQSHILNSQQLDVRPRTFKELQTEPYFPWQSQQETNNPWNVHAVQQGNQGMQPLLPGNQESQKKGSRPKDAEGEESLPITVEDLHRQLYESGCVGIQTQVVLMVELLQVPATELQQRYLICKVLEDALTPFLPGVSVNQFGSSVNGFWVKGCDMDIFLDLSKLGIPCRSEAILLPYTRDIHSLKKNKGPLGQSDVDSMTNLDKLKLVSRILIEHASSCSETQIIPSHRCPLIRFTHASGIKCDLSLNNRLALQNTRLLQSLSLFDSRIKPLVYAIRYWGKLKDVAGNPRAGPKLSNYALTMLVLYYLMNTEPPVLPTIENLASMCGRDRTIIDQWDCSFVSAQFMPQTANVQTVEELLYGFFQFYSHFDFRNTGIAIRTGQPMPDSDFQSDKVIKAGIMNIQDPFVLDHNITLNVSEKLLMKLIRELRIAEGKARSWFDVAFTETKSLMDIFSEDVPYAIVHAGIMNIQDPFVLDHNITLNVSEKLLMKLIRELRIAEGKARSWFDVAFTETKSLMDIFSEDVPYAIVHAGIMNIQDPFVLDHNITLNVSEKLLMKLIRELRIAEGKARSWFDVAFTETKSLMDIFSEDVPNNVDLHISKPKVTQPNMLCDALGEYQFLVELDRSKYSPEVLKELEDEGGTLFNGWCHNMTRFLYHLIECVLMFDCDVRDKSQVGSIKQSRSYRIYRRDDHRSWKRRRSRSQSESQVKKSKTDTDGATTTTGLGAGPTTQTASQESEGAGNTAGTSTSSTKPETLELVTVPGDESEEEEEPQQEEQGKEHDPTEDEYDFGNSEFYIDMDVKVMARIWAMRKKIANELRWMGFEDSLKMEKSVTERLFYDIFGPARRPLLEFRCVIRSVMDGGKASILVDCISRPNQSEFHCVYNFMKKSVLKMIEKYFMK